MINENKNQSRRKFLGWGIASAALLSACRFLSPSAKEPVERKTVKMLSQDGKLVEVDIAAIPSQKKKVSNKELQNWIKK